MISTTGQQEEEMRIAQESEDRQTLFEDLKELFSSIAAKSGSSDGTLKLGDVLKYIENKEDAAKTAKRCGVPARNVVNVLKTMTSLGDPVEVDTFVERMVDAHNHVTEQARMKLENLIAMSRQQFTVNQQVLNDKIDAWENEMAPKPVPATNQIDGLEVDPG